MSVNTKTENRRKKPAKKNKKGTTKKKTGTKKRTKKRVSKSIKAKKLNRKNTIILIAAILVIIGIIIAAVAAGRSSGKSGRIPELKEDVAWGIDVSSHNGKIDWKKVSKKADFVFIRVGYRGYANGAIMKDKNAKANLKGAQKYKIPAGVYFYSQAVNKKEAEQEADFLLKEIKGYDVVLPLVIDFEHATKDGQHAGRLYEASLSKKENTAIINAFCDRVRKAGYTPAVYASSYIYQYHLNAKNIPDDVFIWVADYNKKVSYNGYYDIWQYSEKSKCAGTGSKYVDANYFYTKKRLG